MIYEQIYQAFYKHHSSVGWNY